MTLDREQRREILRKLERLEKVEEEVRQTREELRRAREEIQRLRRENERLKTSAPVLAASDRTAEAGGVPSSKTFYRRPVPRGERRPSGGQFGHPGHGRSRPTPNAPSVQVALERCPKCSTKLGDPLDSLHRMITDLPLPALLIFDLEVFRYRCPGCHRRVHAEPPLPPNRQFGPVLAAWIAHQRMLGLSVEKVRTSLSESFGLSISEASILALEAWVADRLDGEYARLRASVRAASVVGADETSFRINGKNGWLWVYEHLAATVYQIAPTRGKTAVLEVLEGFEGVLGHDAWDPYDAITTADHALDPVHVNRWLERAEVRHRVEPRRLLSEAPAKLTSAGHPPTELLGFVDTVRSIYREAILVVKDRARVSVAERAQAFRRARRRMAALLKIEWKDRDARRIAKELRHRRRTLFTFLRVPGVPYHNNGAENAIRQGVLIRKVSGGRRTWIGARTLERLLTVYRTCRKRGESFRDRVLTMLIGAGPPLPSARPQS
ncbi:MAG: IS66 family transposase [Thermoplasmata archaeon]|nr:IS66 family transposase [Thermoplasmata archaeon]